MKIGFLFFIISIAAGYFFCAGTVSAHLPQLIYSYSGDIQVTNPEVSQAFYDELKGSPRNYFVYSDKGFELYLNLLVPNPANAAGSYSADIFNITAGAPEEKLYSLEGTEFRWQSYYEPFGRDYYLKGPELDQQVPAGKYKIVVYSKDNQGKYVLAVGKKEVFGLKSIFDVYWQLPLLKVQFFNTSVLQFFLTPFVMAAVVLIGLLIVLLFFVKSYIAMLRESAEYVHARTLLLTSGGMEPMKDEIAKLLQKPDYNVAVGFINTAAKPEENKDYMQRDLLIMRDEMRFNVEEIDIEGKTEGQVEKLLETKDLIYVEGGNTFYLLKTMRECNFEKIIRKLLKKGKVYIGVSAGSIVAGRSIKPAHWLGDEWSKNEINLKNLRGLSLVPFDIFPHYRPEWADVMKQNMPSPKQRGKNLKIITDDQAILVQGKDINLIGEGEAVVL